MYNRTVRRLIQLTLITLPLLGMHHANAASRDVLVVPARRRTVAMALDVRALRELTLITYRGTAATEVPLMHVWSPSANAWQELANEDYQFGQFMPSQPQTLFLIGTDRDLPASVIEGASQAASVVRIDSVSMADIANTLNGHFEFSSREWRALAERHGLQTTDLNYERRKWGRFGPPPSAKPDGPEAKPEFPDDEFPVEADDVPVDMEVTSDPPVAAPPAVADQADDMHMVVTPPVAVKPPPPPPIVLDAATEAPLEPEAAPPVTAPAGEQKGATPQAHLPGIYELLPEDK